MTAPRPDSIPLFCVETIETTSGRALYINFAASSKVQAPDVDIDEDKIVHEICDPSPEIEDYKIPLVLSQLFWSANKEMQPEEAGSRSRGSAYVIDIQINEKFALRRVIPSDILRHYLVTVAMISIEGKYNSAGSPGKVCGQFVGHALKLDQASYRILKDQQHFDRSNEVVSNKIVLMEETKDRSMEPLVNNLSGKLNVEDGSVFDLHFRPASMILTCSLETPRLPKSIAFNDDTINIELGGCGECSIFEIILPLKIDLTQPVKYKFDDRLCLLRVVFKVLATIETV